MGSLQTDIDEPIVIVEYDPFWPTLFASERDRIRPALGDLITRIEHFGSTAVPGMAGKPIIDLLVGVRSFAAASEPVGRLEALRYESLGEIFIPGRIYLRRRGPPHFNIALTEEGGDFWNAQLIVRDYLRAHPQEAAAYSHHKREAYEAGSRMFSTYSQAKGPFLTGLLERARQWSDRRRP